jgi:hypothetical protein
LLTIFCLPFCACSIRKQLSTRYVVVMSPPPTPPLKIGGGFGFLDFLDPQSNLCVFCVIFSCRFGVVSSQFGLSSKAELNWGRCEERLTIA